MTAPTSNGSQPGATVLPQYYIANGVRRAVAARESKITRLTAILRVPGQADQQVLVALGQLHSPKPDLPADARYQRCFQGMATAAGRARMPPIEIEPLGAPGQTASVPLRDVQLV